MAAHGFLYRTFRRDVGRKAMSLLLALVLWVLLFSLVVLEGRKSMDVRMVSSRVEAERQAEITDAVYVVVPSGLIVRDVMPQRVNVSYAGASEEMRDLRASVILELDESDLDDEDEAKLPRSIAREDFRFRPALPDFSRFEIDKATETLELDVAVAATAELRLSEANVPVEGQPREGHSYLRKRMAIYPNTVRISGPKPELDRIELDPGLLQFEPVRVAGRIDTVTQSVPLAAEWRSRHVSLLTTAGSVLVTVPLEADYGSIELRSMVVYYLGEDDLRRHDKELVNATRELDVLVTGPPAVVNREADYLRRRILLIVKPAVGGLELVDEAVEVVIVLDQAELLSQVTVTGTDGNEATVYYEIRDLPVPAEADTDG